MFYSIISIIEALNKLEARLWNRVPSRLKLRERHYFNLPESRITDKCNVNLALSMIVHPSFLTESFRMEKHRVISSKHTLE